MLKIEAFDKQVIILHEEPFQKDTLEWHLEGRYVTVNANKTRNSCTYRLKKKAKIALWSKIIPRRLDLVLSNN